ncbi:hypothetical protein FML45_26970 [Klebsiella variicola]|nr:hypothetical protein [Klebsiella variicola]QSI15819.1 hypothetical protein FA956_29535 [Klebsiella quasipneumoniae]RRF73243.1 hypothetical protein EAO18_27795 [Klebsiella pneumoniae]MBZ7795226.1 hypothetical protein [Klebsiella variicola]MBZ7859391.1 hypothetical protein [Klebsiella variicola]
MVYCMRGEVKWPLLSGYAGYEQLWCLLDTPSHAPLRADRQLSTAFDARLNGRASPGMHQ